MAFNKSFPRTTDKSVYPRWEEVYLTETEEREQEDLARQENNKKMLQALSDAKVMMEKLNLKPFQTDMVHIAIALFEKSASHEVYYKENKAKEKFDESEKR